MIRILLADDQDLLCEILQTSLETQADLQIVGRANNGKAALEKVDILCPDIALIDIHMPVMDGLTATKEIVQRFPETKVIILSASDEETDYKNSMAAGAKGFISKTAKASDITNCIRSVYQETHNTKSPELEQTRMLMQIDRVKQEVKSYVKQVDSKLNQVEQTEIKIKQYFDELAHKNGKLSKEANDFKANVEPIIKELKKVAKESKQHATEISRVQTLVEGQLSYVHSLNRRAKKFQKYLLISCSLAAIAILLSLVCLLF